MERDHSQARRTLRHLIKLGLVSQFAIPGQRGRMLQPTETGKAVTRQLEDEGWRRDTMLYGDIASERLDRFLAMLDTLTRNALAQLRAGGDRGEPLRLAPPTCRILRCCRWDTISEIRPREAFGGIESRN